MRDEERVFCTFVGRYNMQGKFSFFACGALWGQVGVQGMTDTHFGKKRGAAACDS